MRRKVITKRTMGTLPSSRVTNPSSSANASIAIGVTSCSPTSVWFILTGMGTNALTTQLAVLFPELDVAGDAGEADDACLLFFALPYA